MKYRLITSQGRFLQTPRHQSFAQNAKSCLTVSLSDRVNFRLRCSSHQGLQEKSILVQQVKVRKQPRVANILKTIIFHGKTHRLYPFSHAGTEIRGLHVNTLSYSHSYCIIRTGCFPLPQLLDLLEWPTSGYSTK